MGSTAVKFEHKVLKYTHGWKGFDYAQMEADLTDLGSQGWEAVGTISTAIGNGTTHEIAVFVKRAWT
jgi:hypothetical protein